MFLISAINYRTFHTNLAHTNFPLGQSGRRKSYLFLSSTTIEIDPHQRTMTPFTPHQIHSFCNIVEESHPVMPYQSSNKKTKKTCNRFISSQSKSHQSQSKSPPKSPLTKLLRSYDNPSNYSLSLSQTHQSHAMSTFTSKELIFLRRSNETLTIASSAQKTTISTLENSVSSLSMQVTSSLQSNRDLSKLCTQHNQDKANLQLANDQLQESLSETKTTLQKLSTKYSQDTTQIKKSTKIMLESAIAEKNAAQLKIRDLEVSTKTKLN